MRIRATSDLPPDLAATLADMTAKERRFLRHALDNPDAARRELEDADYVHTPATIQEFLMDADLLGPVAQIRDWDDDSPEANQGLYPFWKHVLADLFAPDKQYQQLILSLALGCGKTFVSLICLLYKLYLLLEMRDPQDFLGLARATPIVFGFFSATQRLSQADEQKTNRHD
jgi:hypothetical protein